MLKVDTNQMYNAGMIRWVDLLNHQYNVIKIEHIFILNITY